MKEPNYSHVEKNADLRRILKSAAEDSIRSFFPGRDPPDEALEYVVVAFCLGESKAEFNDRLKQLFERDCQSVVEHLTSFVNSHSEFIKQDPKPATLPEPTLRAKPKEDSKSQRQKIVWDKSLDKPAPDLNSQRVIVVKKEVQRRPQLESKEEALEPPSHRRVPRSRLFESALGGIKHQTTSKEAPPPRTHQMENSEIRGDTKLPIPATREPHESILKRIRKPDGSQFEEWELRTQNQVAESRKRGVRQPPIPGTDLEEVQQLKQKIARLEKEVQTAQSPPPINRHLPQNQDHDRRSICVKNVHFLANEEVVAAHFHSCAPIVNISFAKDIYGRPKGFCFVQFVHEASVEKALELDQSLLLGRVISVVRKLSRAPTGGVGRMKIQLSKDSVSEQGGFHDRNQVKDFAIETGSQEIP